MILKNHLSFSIIVVFSFSLISLLFALLLSWAEKSDSSYFLIASFMLAVLGSILCANKKLSLNDVAKVITVAKGK